MRHIVSAALGKQCPLWPIAVGRVMIGLLWLGSLRWKLPPNFSPTSGRGLLDWFHLEAQYPAFDWYGQLVTSVVIPNFILFAWLVFLSELLVAMLLLSGTWTRMAGALGFVMSINLGVGLLAVPGEWPWSYLMMALWHALFVVTAAGRVGGVDGWLRHRLALSSSWRIFT